MAQLQAGDRVRIKSTGETGQVVGPIITQNKVIYVIRLKDGRHAFYAEDALEAERREPALWRSHSRVHYSLTCSTGSTFAH